jgi:hypothetical protein
MDGERGGRTGILHRVCMCPVSRLLVVGCLKITVLQGITFNQREGPTVHKPKVQKWHPQFHLRCGNTAANID